jgi:DNA-binding response OmpR family regulator
VRALVADPSYEDPCAVLRRAGVAADGVSDVDGVDLALAVNGYDCVVLDRSVPSALFYVHGRRRRGWPTPVLFTSAQHGADHRVESFEHGADDHLAKPYALAELVARVRSLGRRAPLIRPAVLHAGDLSLDACRCEAARAGTPIPLTAKEFAVLHLLMTRAGEVVSRSALLEQCWDAMTEPMSNVVDVLVGQLRRKVGASLIHTVRGMGYRLSA